PASSSSTDPKNENNSACSAATFSACIIDPIVITSADSGTGSLRKAIQDACVGSTITFDMTPGHVTSPITLTTSELVIDKNLTIQGPTTASLTISGNNNSRVFNVQTGNSLVMSNLTITGGKITGDNGGGIFRRGRLTMINSTAPGY